MSQQHNRTCSIDESKSCNYPDNTDKPWYKRISFEVAIYLLTLIIALTANYIGIQSSLELLAEKLDRESEIRAMVDDSFLDRFEQIDKNQQRTVEILDKLSDKTNTNSVEIGKLQK